ncbi:MAG: protein BatD [Calditrichaeota bacterium]|nr:MAG: protein BatD [Calditrichota bacterium]
MWKKGVLLGLMWVAVLSAADIRLSAYVSDNSVRLDQRFEYTVKLTGSRAGLPDVQFPDLKDFYVLSGPNQSTSMQWINGDMTASKSYSFILKPRKKGRLTIGPAQVKVDGTILKSDPLTITVSDAAAPSKNKNTEDAAVSGKNVFLKVIPSKTEAYVGEMILVSYKLYFKINVETYEVQHLPAFTGFWTEDFELPRQPVIQNEVVNGLNYNVVTLKKTALFPTRSGKIKLEPMEITVQALMPSRRRRSRSIFDSFFDAPGRRIQVPVASRSLQFNILPLPDEDKPADFNGAVGHFRMKTTLDKKTVAVNDAVTLKIQLAGQGNIKLLNVPEPVIPPDIERYDPKIHQTVKRKNSTVSGVKTAEYILIPRVPGDYTIAPGAFTFFDPDKKAYVTLKNPSYRITVSGKAGNGAPISTGGMGKREVALLGRDIRYIRENTRFLDKSALHRSMTQLAWAHIGALAFFALFLFYDQRRVRLTADTVSNRKRNAGRVAARWLKDARAQREADAAAFYKALNEALTGFIRDKLNMDLSAFNADDIENYLKNKAVSDTTVDKVKTALNETLLRQYGGTGDTREDRERLLNDIRVLINQLEKEL